MKKRLRQKMLAVLAATSMVISVSPMYAPVKAEAATGTAEARNVNLKKNNVIAGINDPVVIPEDKRMDESYFGWDGGLGSYVYFGNYMQYDTNGDGKATIDDKKQPIQWCVLDACTSGVYNDADSMLLMSEKLLDHVRFNYMNRYDIEDKTQSCNDWQDSMIQSLLNSKNCDKFKFKTIGGFLDNAFDAKEQDAILLSDGNYGGKENWIFENMPIGGCKVFILSKSEIENVEYGFPHIASFARYFPLLRAVPTDYAFSLIYGYEKENIDDGYRRWWVRSKLAGEIDGVVMIEGEGNLGYVLCDATDHYVRPCINLDWSKIVFSTAVTDDGTLAVNKTATFSKTGSDKVGQKWKLTMYGSESNSNASLKSGNVNLTKGYSEQKITVSYKAATSVLSGATQTSAMLTDSNGTVVCYGKAGTAGATSSQITLPAGLAVGKYKLYVFAEKVNSGLSEDYASKLGTPITITVNKIKPTSANVSYNGATVIYNGKQQGVTVTPKSGVGTATVYYEGINGTSYSKTTKKPVEAGSYQITMNLSEGSNYLSATGIKLGVFTIQPKTLTNIKASIPNVAYGSESVLQQQVLSVSAEGILSNDNVKAVCSRIERPDTDIVGLHTNGTVEIARLTNSNYVFVPDSGKSTVTLKNQSYSVLEPIPTPSPTESIEPLPTEPSESSITTTVQPSQTESKPAEVVESLPAGTVEPSVTVTPQESSVTESSSATAAPVTTREPIADIQENVQTSETDQLTSLATVTEKIEIINNAKTYTLNGIQYKIQSKGTVVVVGMKNKKKTTLVIPATVKIKEKTYKVTQIAQSAFKNCKKLKKVTIGKNVTAIGKQAFQNCTSLKTVTIKSSKLKSVGKKSFYKVNKKAVIKVSKKKLKTYKKLLKGKGQATTVQIKSI